MVLIAALPLILPLALIAPPPAAPPPPPPMPMVLARPGTAPAHLAFAEAAVEAWRAGYGLAPTAMRREVFADCLAGPAEGLEACLRAVLREERAQVGEVGVLVVVSSAPDGRARWRCLGGSRQGVDLRPEAQRLELDAAADPASPATREAVERCIGGAFAEYMVP